MIYTLKPHKDKLIEQTYAEGMKELNRFFGIGWKHHTPPLFVLKNRKEIDQIRRQDSNQWLIGFATAGIVYILDRKNKNIEKESDYKEYSDEQYVMLIKHELCHLFFNTVSGRQMNYPRWLTEGVSIYLSGQLKYKKPVEKFSALLDSYDQAKDGAYLEGGEAVRLLVEKFGKKKLLALISRLKEAGTPKAFAKLFKEVYGFNPSYKAFNDLLAKSKKRK